MPGIAWEFLAFIHIEYRPAAELDQPDRLRSRETNDVLRDGLETRVFLSAVSTIEATEPLVTKARRQGGRRARLSGSLDPLPGTNCLRSHS